MNILIRIIVISIFPVLVSSCGDGGSYPSSGTEEPSGGSTTGDKENNNSDGTYDSGTNSESGNAGSQTGSNSNDYDGDGIADIDNNCPYTPNPDQENSDAFGTGDACESVSTGNFSASQRLSEIPPGTALDLGKYSCKDRLADGEGEKFGCWTNTDYSRINYDPYNHRILLFGGGHGATGQTSIDAFDLKSEELDWQYLYSSMSCEEVTVGDIDSKGFHRLSGHPVARHTYDMSVIAPVNGKAHLLLLSTEGFAGRCHQYNTLIKSVARFPLEDNSMKWNYGREWKRLPWYYAASAEYDPVSGMIIIIGRGANSSAGGMWVYDPDADDIVAFTPIAYEGYENALAYYPPTQSMYLFERSDPVKIRHITLNRGDWSKSTSTLLSPSGDLPNRKGKAIGLAYNQDLKVFGGPVIDNKFYSYNPISNKWTSSLMHIDSTKVDDIGDTVFSIFEYDPVNRIYIFMALPKGASGQSKRTWAYRQSHN